MNSIDIFFSKAYLKSNTFWMSLLLVVIFIALLVIPSVLFFYLDILNIDNLFSDYGANKNKYPLLYHKVGELLPWVVVCLTALIVICGNTVFYIITFSEELIEEKFQTKKYWFKGITWLFFTWAAVSIIFLIKFIFCFVELTNILMDAKLEKIADATIIVQAAHLFNKFVSQVEYYTLITIGLFILIDILSRVVKRKQISKISLNSSPSEKLNRTTKILSLQREFVTNQLLLIDIPILIGIILISMFTGEISPTIGNDPDAKYIFIAGGIGMHLIMSQVIFLILNLRYKFSEYRIELLYRKYDSEKNASPPTK